jgi:hypothetical protein
VKHWRLTLSVAALLFLVSSPLFPSSQPWVLCARANATRRNFDAPPFYAFAALLDTVLFTLWQFLSSTCLATPADVDI